MGTHRDTSEQSTNSEELADILSHPVRRCIVKHLREHEGSGLQLVTIDVVRQEAERQGVSITEIGHSRMQREIEEEHLPVMTNAGILDYHEDTEWIALDGMTAEDLDPFLND